MDIEKETELVKGIDDYKELFDHKDNPAFFDRFKEIYMLASTTERQAIEEFVITKHSDLTILLTTIKRELGSEKKEAKPEEDTGDLI